MVIITVEQILGIWDVSHFSVIGSIVGGRLELFTCTLQNQYKISFI